LTHVPPGQSVEVALAKKATPVQQPVAKTAKSYSGPGVEPDLPSGSPDGIATVSDFFTLGCLFMEQGNYTDAIGAFEKALKLDPTFTEACNNLAICYQNSGQEEKAVQTFQKYKALTTR
jgi:tetratricopeptide (TPR) repeat protein